MLKKIITIYLVIAALFVIYYFNILTPAGGSKAYFIGFCIGKGLVWPFSLFT